MADIAPPPTALPRLEPRAPDSHKGDYGRALLVGGSRGMTGAIALAGMATLRSGAGLVTLAVPAGCLETVAAFEPSYMTAPLPDDGQGRIAPSAKDKIAQLAAPATCVGCGPGIGRGPPLTQLVCWMYTSLAVPAVFDADALFALAEQPGQLARHAGPRILTPHPGEFRRFVPDELSSRDQLESRAVEMAAAHNLIVVLKGHRTLITDGKQTATNPTGNPGMATGGSGDILTGVIVALLCQGLCPFEAAQLAVYVHGLAGDLAAQQLGQVSLIATDLAHYLPQAFRTLQT